MYSERFKEWAESPKLSREEKAELTALAENEKEIEYRFGKELEFGTAGMRGIMGAGTNMMNVHTVRRATQGLADYIKSLGLAAMKRGVAISYDTRKNSRLFAEIAADVLATNNIKTYLFKKEHPVPMLSFAVRELGAAAGVMITASHNPKEYNGYKVFGEDGAQMAIEDTEKLVRRIEEIESCFSGKIKYGAPVKGKIRTIGASLDRKYYRAIGKLTLSGNIAKKVGKEIKLVYTPLHGSGFVPVTTILKKLGIRATIVEEQSQPDPGFTTVNVPNPEFKESLSMGIRLADKIRADVVFGTDPDCDRLGVAVRNGKGEFVALSGNQAGVLLLDYVLGRLKETGRLPANGFVVKSFVTTSMAKAIADDYGAELMDVPVGFKFIGEKIKQFDDTGSKKFLFGFEESCGYLRGTHCRDKDAVVASMLFAEMVCYYTYKNTGVFQRLKELYGKYGYCLDKNASYNFGGVNAMEEMNAVVEKLRRTRLDKIDIYNVVAMRDYSLPARILADGTEEALDIPKNNSVYYELENGSFICVRPSGTEPKLKIYFSVKLKDFATAEKAFEKLRAAMEEIAGIGEN